jgi:hypothetical protein
MITAHGRAAVETQKLPVALYISLSKQNQAPSLVLPSDSFKNRAQLCDSSASGQKKLDCTPVLTPTSRRVSSPSIEAARRPLLP